MRKRVSLPNGDGVELRGEVCTRLSIREAYRQIMMALYRSVLPLCALLLSGCVGLPYHPFPAASTSTAYFADPADEGTLVGIAISGGGSRAATFAAAVLEELARIPVDTDGEGQKSLIEKVNYISSVSGGSLAAAYFGLLKPGRNVPVLSGTDLSTPYRSFFQKFNSTMQQDFEGALIRGVLLGRELAVNAIAGEWDDRIFHGATFSDIYAREQRRDCPTLILNATSFDNGRRFVFTTLPQKAFEFNLAHEIAIRLTPGAIPEDELRSLRKALDDQSADHVPMTFEEIAVDPRPFRVSLAVAASSAVPYVIGPLTLGVGEEPRRQLYHLADGGLVDNQGLESLFQLFAGKLRSGGIATAGARRKGLIIAVDASSPATVTRANHDETESRLSSLTQNPARLSAIIEQSGKDYRLLLWSVLRGTPLGSLDIMPGFDEFKIVNLRYIDADVALAKRPPAECAGTIPKSPTPEQMKERLAQIATRYEISDRCDVALLRAAAHAVVSEATMRITDFLR